MIKIVDVIMKGNDADIRKCPICTIISFLMSCLSVIYGIAIKIVDRSYISGIRKTVKAEVPVISVGNITVGGTGKTPFALMLAEYYISNGKAPGILTRGYGRDECRMYGDIVPDIKVYVGRERIKTAGKAVAEGCDVLILDDGYQHRTLARDLNILLVDGQRPFGSGHLLPRGVLREPVRSIKRADMIVITKSDGAKAADVELAMRKAGLFGGDIPVFRAKHEPSLLMDVSGSGYPASDIKGESVMLVSGIADPGSFRDTVSRLGAGVKALMDYPDHHSYTADDVSRIHDKMRECPVDRILTTEKDFVKLKRFDLSDIEEKLFVIRINMELCGNKEDFFGRLDRLLHG